MEGQISQTRGGFIKSSTDLVKTLKADCELTAPGIQEQIPLIIEIILLAVENQDRQIEIAMRQNLVSVGGENVDTPHKITHDVLSANEMVKTRDFGKLSWKKYARRPLRRRRKRSETAAEKAQSTKAKKAGTTRDNTKRALTHEVLIQDEHSKALFVIS